jgi:hypothetical protein
LQRYEALLILQDSAKPANYGSNLGMGDLQRFEAQP